MERITLRLPKQQIDDLEDLVEDGLFPTRSEAIRSGVRDLVDGHRGDDRRRRRRRY